ncbi:negative acting factor [Fusarium longipes]|uniref:Negative acting factor n=1 Tax=Fusarium longipes TaxID=694270 RepID=A0A395T6W8_9HYPO|nr:negative acting factor [Fusarium longipes]
MSIDEIIKLLGQVPPPQSGPHTEEMINEITKVYHEMYAHGLSAFFETTWYFFTENGKMSLPRNPHLVDLLAFFLKTLENVSVNDHSQMAYSGIIETRLVWELARSAYDTPTLTSAVNPGALPAENDAKEAQNRVRVVEALLCGDYLPSNPLCPPLQDPDNSRTRQFDFWYSLAEFVRTRDNPTAQPAVKVREDMLQRMRYLLDGRENRDVLYSIAVVRELSPHFDSQYANNTPQHVDESDPKNRLAVASKFIFDESQVTGGTTNVVRRFCDIAHRAFVNPGVNIARRN